MGEYNKSDECRSQTRDDRLTELDPEKHAAGDMLQIYDYDGSENKGSDRSGCRGFLPVVPHYIGEEGACGAECEAEHQDGNNALGVEQGNEHGGNTYQAHHDLCHVHD